MGEDHLPNKVFEVLREVTTVVAEPNTDINSRV